MLWTSPPATSAIRTGMSGAGKGRPSDDEARRRRARGSIHSGKAAAATPVAFRDVLLEIARSVS
jgi:hypothetical protein